MQGKESAAAAASAVLGAFAIFFFLKSIYERKSVETRLTFKSQLTRAQIQRYGRQLLLKQIGPEGQRRICDASVLVVGAGGLGCPIIAQLAGAGVGLIGIIDGDLVEESNLHRQTLHLESAIGKPKALSAKWMVSSMNSSVKCRTHLAYLTSENVEGLISEYDLVIEATDSLAVKYFISDACSLYGKPFVSGSAQGLEGQAALFLPGNGCYRCLFPTPPAISERSTCEDDGVLGSVPSFTGCLQGHLAIQYLSDPSKVEVADKFYMFDGNCGASLFQITFNKQAKSKCARCGEKPSILSMADSQRFADLHELEKSCAIYSPTRSVPSCTWESVEKEQAPFLLVDVRPEVQYRIWSLRESHNIPIELLQGREMEDSVAALTELASQSKAKLVFVFCRRGNDSRFAVDLLQNHLAFQASHLNIYNVTGGLQALARLKPAEFPFL